MKTVKRDRISIAPMSDLFGQADKPLMSPATVAAAWLEGGMMVLSKDGGMLQANEALVAWLGLETTALVGQNLRDVLGARHPEWRTLLQELIDGQAPFGSLQLATGGETPLHYRLDLARHGDRIFGRLDSVLPSAAELAEGAWDESLHGRRAQHQMFTRLIQAESRLDVLMRRWPGVIFSQRADFSFHFISAQIEDLTGIPPEQWQRQGQLFWQVVHEADADEVRNRVHRSVLQRQPASFTYRIRHSRTGRVTYLLEHRDPVVTANGIVLGYEGFWIDVTRQTIAERRLSSAAWKETLSVVTMGLAHDFRNLMAGIGALSEQFLHQAGEDHSFRENMQLIMNNSRQASQLVHRIISLHNGQPGERNYHDLNELIREVAELTRKIIPRTIQLNVVVHEGTLPVYVDAVEFRQVIINLVLNALDAMPTRGSLTLGSTLHGELPAWEHGCGTAPRLPAAALSIRDTGTGIKPRHLSNLFDPFFTTKALNKGSGLGLYNARMFVEKHQGAISVESTAGQGATFRVWLPVADFTEGEREHASRPAERRSLLFAGAEGRTSDNTVEFLRTAGYHVVEAHSSELATAMLDSGEHPFAGLFVQTEDVQSDFATLLLRSNGRHGRLKTILQIVGRNEDEYETGFLRRADLVLGADLPQAAIHQRLEELFASA
ncbi:MAG TPA: hypothetical protein DCY13_12900 [Verrucomicrobiales bacterium]|nr:hypothetical protein [Verrucomicrobiales bacterium]